MREVMRTFVRLVLFTCTALVLITGSASHVAGVPHVLEAMAYAAVPAVMVAGAIEAVVLTRDAG
ncbi:hypothetical protein HX779_08485 [Pseudomonas sp. A4002]|uniref:hypothetical protein n=1 Tax=unclassified Pseudomonas TaxID=196821 RepID=UPI0015A025D2|nr:MULTISPECIES: hypothetical protein [unclassified Pseudomonas]NVZ32009.1 hypothetical protein [Pseudomonas sp. A4002]NWB79253.1 hypothetical protein [Pseudomonas sp. F9001]